tara:strand:- start:6 stop:620 length:615 start_codon:yes stop_codon:yes gene_type:complete
MKFLKISFLLITLISCNSLKTTKNLPIKEVFKVIDNSYFSDNEIDYTYKAKILAGKNNFGGILIVKKIDNEHHRIVFTTEFGNKIFDFEFVKNKFIVNFILDKLDRKIILNALKKDYQLLIKEQHNADVEYIVENGNMYQSTLNKKDNYFFFDKENNLLKIVMASKRKEKMTIHFNNIENNIAKKIEMNHHNFNIITQLNYINN